MTHTYYFFVIILTISHISAMEKNTQAILDDLSIDTVHNRIRTFTECNLKRRSQESRTDDSIRYFFSSFQNHLANMVTFTAIDTQEKAEALIKEICEKDKRMVWWVTPFTKPANMGELLEKNGFHPNPMAAMGCSLSDMKMQTLDDILNLYTDKIIVQTTDLTKAVEGKDIKIPQIKSYELFYENNSASKCYAFIQDKWAALYGLSTNENMQKKGLATAVVVALLKDIKESGCIAAYMVAVPMSVIIGTKLGFKRFGDVNYYYKLESTCAMDNSKK
jgi:N-acetylglutamate synthase-like GNAT family acetyltransferase